MDLPEVCLWTPAPLGSRRGNRVTSSRWARLLRARGFAVTHTSQPRPSQGTILLALHAVAAREVLLDWKRGPRVVVLTGTDLNGKDSALALDTAAQVEAVVTLQPLDRQRLPAALRVKTRVIMPAVELPAGLHWVPRPEPVACCLAHLRAVKQPLTLPQALQYKPEWTGLHLGAELEPGWAAQLESWPRFRWLGEKSRLAALRILSRCACFVLPSLSEGCSNALCEAVALGLPVLASDIPGNRGLLGPDFPGYFPAGDARALSELLCPSRLGSIHSHCSALRAQLQPEREQEELCGLLADLGALLSPL